MRPIPAETSADPIPPECVTAAGGGTAGHGAPVPVRRVRDGGGTLAELPAQAVDRARVVKWQTRWLQVPVLARACGFKSRLAHRNDPLNGSMILGAGIR